VEARAGWLPAGVNDAVGRIASKERSLGEEEILKEGSHINLNTFIKLKRN